MTTAPQTLSRRDVAVGYVWNALFGLVSKALFPILQLLFYRVLGPQQVGIYLLILPIFMITETIRDAGIGVTYISDTRAEPEREGGYATFAILSAFAFAAIIFCLRGVLAGVFHVPELNWGLSIVAVAVGLNGFCVIPANKLQKKARFRDAGFADFTATLVSFVIALVLVMSGFGYKALVWQFFAKGVVYLVICYSLEPVHARPVKPDLVRSIWRHSSSNLVNNLLFCIYTVADALLVTKLFGTDANGYYGAAYTTGTKPLEFFTFPLSRTLLVAYSRKSEDKEGLAHIFARTIAVSILALFPLYVLIGVFAKPIVEVLLSKRFEATVPLLGLLAIYCGCRSIGSLSGNVLVAMKRQIYNLYGWIGAYLSVGLILWFQRDNLTLYNTVVAITVGAVVVYVVNTASAFHFLRPSSEDRAHLGKALLLSGVTSAAVLAAANLPFDGISKLCSSLVMLVPLHLAGIGMIFVGSPTACFSKSGLKLLWKTL